MHISESTVKNCPGDEGKWEGRVRVIHVVVLVVELEIRNVEGKRVIGSWKNLFKKKSLEKCIAKCTVVYFGVTPARTASRARLHMLLASSRGRTREPE